ncbi:MAG: serine hydrolase [Cyclobacteriaceae bacterium]|nr:MAG: serine hydrolase [Cyclobacteriaceae bacterium]
MKKLLFIILVFGALAAHAQTPEAKLIKEFDAYIEKSRKQYQVPGLAITVVKDGKVLLKKGYGLRQINKPDAVNDQTLFACASTTKAMTATCMAMLVDEGKVTWDDAVIKHLPDFQLYDPYVTRELKIRDLFTHNSGVGNTDFLWGVMDIPSDEVLARMKQVKPTYSLRSSFIYQNIFYGYAGKVIEKVSGLPWEVFIKQRIFEPLGMTRSYPHLQMVNDANQTSEHYWVDGKITVISRTNADAIGPAGSVWSSIDDMSKWAICMLDSSKYAGGRLVKPTTWVELFKPQVIVPANQFYPTAQLTKPNWTTYSLGWFQQDYKGKKVNFHTGSLAGETAIHGQLPESKLGIYIFGNLDHAEVRHALMFKAFDAFALGGTRDWSTEFHTLYKNLGAQAEQKQKEQDLQRIPNTKSSLALTEYTGKYASSLYGETHVTTEGNSLIISINNVVSARLDHWHYDTFSGWFDKRWWGKTKAQFRLDASGKATILEVEGMEFTRVQ